MFDEEFFKKLKEDIGEAVHSIRGGSRYGSKLKKTSFIFLTIPDPTMISTGIGLSLFTLGKILEYKKDKSINDLLLDYNIELEEVKEVLRKTLYTDLI